MPTQDWRDWIADMLGIRPDDRGELLDLLNRLARDESLLNEQEISMIKGVLRMREWKIRDVMLRRSDVVGMKIDDDYKTAVQLVRDWQHSRYPVFDKNNENVKGILLAKDLLGFTDRPDAFVMETVMRKPVFEPLTKPLNVLLDDFLQQRSHMVIVIDEHTRPTGIITIEDLLESIVGEIQDESDDEDDRAVASIDKTTQRVRGTISIEEFNAYFKSSLPAGASDSIAGWLAAEIGQTPKQGETIEKHGFVFYIEEADERRIYKIIIKQRPSE